MWSIDPSWWPPRTERTEGSTAEASWTYPWKTHVEGALHLRSPHGARARQGIKESIPSGAVDLTPLVERLASGGIRTAEELQRAKVELCRSRPGPLPSNPQILAALPGHLRPTLEPLLRIKPVRTASGVAVVSAMTSPAACPHGKCTFCPGGPDWGTPQSYVGSEPAARRAAAAGYDPQAQVASRLRQLREIGHAVDKVDLIIIGGTFTARPEGYRETFVKGCFDAMNGHPCATLAEAHAANETADVRCIGLTVETKPDWFLGPEVEHSLALGTTRIELGVQSLRDPVLRAVHRGHTDDDTRRATERAKEAGLKVCYHVMPGLPGTDSQGDLLDLRRLFLDEAYRPDMLKIYPTLVVPGTALHRQWRMGLYHEMDLEAAIDLLVQFKAQVPPWVRIQRIQREIPAAQISAGVRKGDLRNLVAERMRAEGRRCRCLRCREVGLRPGSPPEAQNLEEMRRDYPASGGREVFLSLEEPSRDVVVAYARLRGTVQGRAFLRELRVFGQVVPLAEGPGERWQHRGIGRGLLAGAEAIARDEWGCTTLLVTSGVGVRPYYRRYARARGSGASLVPPGYVGWRL